MKKKFVAPGISVIEVPEAGLSVLCGSPENTIKLLIKEGVVHDVVTESGKYETGPNAVLLSDLPVQNGVFSNLAEFPVLQMLYRHGLGIPKHPGNDGHRPMIIGLEEQVRAQAEYIYIGNYGLPTIEELEDAGLTPEVASERMRMKVAFAFGNIKKTEELLDLRIVDKEAVELRNEVFLHRTGLNRYEFIYRGQTEQVDMNLGAGESYPAPYTLPSRSIPEAQFAVTHIGEGDGWDPSRPCMASILTVGADKYLIDAGPHIADSLRALNIRVEDLKGIFMTHAHDDHFVGLTSLVACEKKPKLFTTPPVYSSVMRKFCAVAGVDKASFRQMFDLVALREGTWNPFDGFDVMPIFSPHPVETDIYRFRVPHGDSYKTYAHLADITSFPVLDRMTTDDPHRNGVSKELADQAKAAYLVPTDLKKVDIGGGMIHGDAKDFAQDQSGEVFLSHLARDLDATELSLGKRADFGETTILIPKGQGSGNEPGSGKTRGARVKLMGLLSETVLFAPPLSLTSLRSIARSSTTKTFRAGERVSVMGRVFVIISGTIHVKSGSLTLETLKSADCFGEAIALFQSSGFLYAVAAEDSKLMVIPEEAIAGNPLLHWRLHELLEKRLTDLRSLFPMKWVPEYSVRVRELDLQHQEEFSLVEQVIQYYRQNNDGRPPLSLMDKLETLEQKHFATEDDLMERSAYPNYEEHHREHQRLMARLQDLRSRAESVGSDELVNFMKDLILRHTLLVDRQYIEYLAPNPHEP